MNKQTVKVSVPSTTALRDERVVIQAVRDAVNLWRPLLGLGDWRVDLQREAMNMASCTAEPKYKIARLTFNPARAISENYSPLRIESTVVHELVHAILWPLCNDGFPNPKLPEEIVSHFEETVTEHIAASLLRARYGNLPALANLWRSSPL